MKKSNIFATALIGVLVLFTTSCNKSEAPTPDNAPMAILEVSTKAGSEGVTTFALNNICPILDVTNPLTADEIEFLYAMREDEKFSKDLYSFFATAYPANVQFANIATAEANHIAAIERIFGYYEVEFPALGEAGVFADAELQTKYDELIVTTSALEAFGVVASVEEANITAYQTVLASAENANIKRLLENMVKASSNHLKAAVRQITAIGGTYTPTTLDQEVFDQIINSAFGRGNKYGQQNGQGGNDGNTNAQKGGQVQGEKGSVNSTGDCTGTNNGTTPGTGGGKGGVGKGYRGGR